MSLYFRGKLYENTLRNRIIANVYTFMFRSGQEIDHYLHKYVYLLVCLLLGLSLFGFCSCDRDSLYFNKPLSLPHCPPDTCVVDSQSVHGHDYLLFYRPAKFNNLIHLEPFQVLHSPDCYCRYNRKFIVVKHE